MVDLYINCNVSAVYANAHTKVSDLRYSLILYAYCLGIGQVPIFSKDNKSIHNLKRTRATIIRIPLLKMNRINYKEKKRLYFMAICCWKRCWEKSAVHKLTSATVRTPHTDTLHIPYWYKRYIVNIILQ